MPSGLDFKSNYEDGSDIRLIWDGSNFLNRVTHTAIWRYRPRQQTGYYAVAWHSPNGGPGTWDSGEYSFGTHPYPAVDGTVDGTGKESTGNGSVGTSHWWEIAGAGEAKDWLTSAGGTSGMPVLKDKWYVQIRRARQLGDGSLEYRFVPDYTGNPNFEIIHVDSGGLGTSGSAPAFYFGGSDWQSNVDAPGRNNETPSGIVRGIQLYNAWLDNTSWITEALNDVSNTPQTVSGSAYVWYINQNPTSADVNDKSGAGHNPTWANNNRPAIWTSGSPPDVTVSVPTISGTFATFVPTFLLNSTFVVATISGTMSFAPISIAGPIEVSSFGTRLRF